MAVTVKWTSALDEYRDPAPHGVPKVTQPIERGAATERVAETHSNRMDWRYWPQALKASSKARVPGVPFSIARIARLPLV